MNNKPIPDNTIIRTDHDNRSVLDLIRDIKSKAIEPRSISVADRQACGEHLLSEGFTIAEIATIFNRNDRTIMRDRQAIQERNALQHDPELASQMAGRLLTEAELCASRIRRAVRDRETNPSVRIDAEHKCFQIMIELTNSLQSLGYLPTAAVLFAKTFWIFLYELPPPLRVKSHIKACHAVSARPVVAALAPNVIIRSCLLQLELGEGTIIDCDI